jgi:putative protease
MQSWHPVQELTRAMERYRVLLPFAVEALDILCLKA